MLPYSFPTLLYNFTSIDSIRMPKPFGCPYLKGNIGWKGGLELSHVEVITSVHPFIGKCLGIYSQSTAYCQCTGQQLKVSVLADNWRSVYWLTIEVFLADCGKSKHTIHKILPQLPPVWTHSILRICSRVLVTWQVKMVGCICDLECHGMLALAWAPELSGSSERPWRKYGEKPAFLTFIDPWLDKTENRTRKQMWSHRNIC